MSKKVKFILIMVSSWIFCICLAISITWSCVYLNTMKKIGISSKSFFATNVKVDYIKDFENKYESFIDDEKAEYIVKLSNDFNVDSDLVISILEKENPTLVTDATSKLNQNGTRDLGLFQLNDKSLYIKDGFIELWWKPEFGEFNADNWKHNTYIAVKYIQDLAKTFGPNNIYYIAAGYNAGIPRAYKAYINNDKLSLPTSTVDNYAPTVENNYKKWKALL